MDSTPTPAGAVRRSRGSRSVRGRCQDPGRTMLVRRLQSGWRRNRWGRASPKPHPLVSPRRNAGSSGVGQVRAAGVGSGLHAGPAHGRCGHDKNEHPRAGNNHERVNNLSCICLLFVALGSLDEGAIESVIPASRAPLRSVARCGVLARRELRRATGTPGLDGR